MSDSEWVWGSKRSEGRKGKPIKVSTAKCPKCGNPIDTYTDGSVGKHKDYGKDKKTGKAKTKGAWAYCSYVRWQ